jgi:hypothetical protein
MSWPRVQRNVSSICVSSTAAFKNLSCSHVSLVDAPSGYVLATLLPITFDYFPLPIPPPSTAFLLNLFLKLP